MRSGRLVLTALMAFVLAATWSAASASPPGTPATWEPRGNNVVYRGVSTAVKADISPPLRDLVPLQAGNRKAEDEERESNLVGPCGPAEPSDPVAQTCLPDAPQAIPSPIANFDGFTNQCGGCSPPDPVGDVGPNHYVAMANSSFAVYSKTGTLLYGPADINTIWSGFGGPCQNENAGDPVVLYDQLADRWLMSQFTANGPTYYNCVCLSTSGDPTGTWQRYAFKTPIDTGVNFPDYPKYGVWPDAYYISTREFGPSGPFAGVGAYALNRTQMLAGNLSPQVVSFLATPGSTAYNVGDGLLPADLDGTTPPAAGTPEFFLGTMDNGAGYSAPQDAMTLWKFHVDWTTPSNSTFTLASTIPVAAFDSIFSPCGGGRSCIPQPGTSTGIDILSYRQRPLHRAAYRNFGTYQAIATNQSVAGTSSVAGVRWYELRDPNGTPTIYQQGTFVPGATDGTHRWMGSIAMDRVGNMALGYSASSSSVYPSIWYTGRLVTDALGQMPQGEGTFITGAGSQTGSNRWGDYTSMNVDPTDDCTFWYVNQYFTTSSSANWKLHIGSFRFPACVCAVTPAAPLGTSASAPADNQITLHWDDSATASITQYFVLRGTAAGGPYTQVAAVPDSSPGTGGSGTYTYDDTPVSGGTRFYYVIRANDGATCTSANSAEVNALATGPCTFAPTFAGLTSVSNPPASTICELDLAWSAGSSNCGGGSVTYSVYRSTVSGFTPNDVTNRIASGLTSNSYADFGVSSGTTYYYIVRAFETAGASNDGNTVQKSGMPGIGTTSYVSTDIPKTIPDNNTSGATSNIVVAGNPNAVQDVNVTLNISHTNDRDLVLTLIAPNATSVLLCNKRGRNGVNFTNTVFDDSATTPIASGAPPFTGSFQPESPLSAVNGITANGTWQLKAVDSAAGNTGSITGWSLDIKTGNVCTSAATPPGVPSGAPGTPMLGSKTDAAGSNITVTWDNGCAGNQYEIVYGTNGQLPSTSAGTYNLTGVKCNIGTAGPYSWNPAPSIPGGSNFIWWLVVATDGSNTEGSWGRNTSQERTGPGAGGSSAGASGACVTGKSLTNTCGQ